MTTTDDRLPGLLRHLLSILALPCALVVRGPHRHVRNPMMSGAAMLLAAGSLATGSLLLLGRTVLFLTVDHLHFIAVEEPGLVRRFGADDEEYRRHVPRWRPRLTPWTPPGP